MKFDFCIGNPPYQETAPGESTSDKPVYHFFMDAAYAVADKVELIHPARFLFNAGSTPKAWNKKILSDVHFKVLKYEQDGRKIFPNNLIEGGIAVSYRDKSGDFGSIDIFTAFEELNKIMDKVVRNSFFKSLSDIVISRTAYRLTDKLHRDYPNAIHQLSDGHAYDMSTNIFERLPQVFFNSKPTDRHKYICVLGRENNNRVFKYIRKDYVNNVVNLEKYKVFVPKSNGSGALGKNESTVVIGNPVIGVPLMGNTESFISIGILNSRDEAEACLKYIKSKFARCMLGILKITQDNPPDRWKFVPMQDFTNKSDIDWSKSVREIDQQLYKKYGLTDEEINFIETKVKEMA